jgi:hypothetical protein
MKFIKKYNEGVDNVKPDIDLINDILVYLKDEGFITFVDVIDSDNINYVDISISLPTNPSNIDLRTTDPDIYFSNMRKKIPLSRGRYTRYSHIFFKLDEIIDTLESLVSFLSDEYNYTLYYISGYCDNLDAVKFESDGNSIFIDCANHFNIIKDFYQNEEYKDKYYRRIDLTFRYQ